MGDCARFVLPRHTPDKDAVYEESSSSQSASRAAVHGAGLSRAFAVITGSGRRRETACADDQSIGQPAAQQLQVPLDRPASMGGRIDDIAVSESDPNIIYVGYAVGGVFKSENNGTTFEPVFETYGTASIGDIAIHPTTRTSSTSAPVNRTTGRRRRSATASTRPPTAARRSRTSGCARRRRSRAS